MKTQGDEQKMTLWAVLCALASILCLVVAFEFGSAPSLDVVAAGSERTSWLDKSLTPVLPRIASTLGARRASRSTLAVVQKPKVTSATNVVGSQGTRRENHDLVVPETIAVHEEMALRRSLSELQALDEADLAVASHIARACDLCEEGLADADTGAASGRERLRDARARLVSRGEAIVRVARELEFVQD